MRHITEYTENDILKQYYSMLYPEKLRQNEYIRLVALRRDASGKIQNTLIRFVQNYEDYEAFIMKYRYSYDIYNQIATNRNCINGTKNSQRCRKVMYLDFDRKDCPGMELVQDFSKMIKEKLPKFFIHAVVDSGHGYHFYTSIKGSCKLDEIVKLNQAVAEIVGADLKAVSPTQISRPPCTFNHKTEIGYDYENRENWKFVRVVHNSYMVGEQFKRYSLDYISGMIANFYLEMENQEILDKQPWNYEVLENYPCYLCVRKILNEGADKGERNFWHGRIVKLLQMEGYRESMIYSMCKSYNQKCRPPKSDKEIEEDTKRFLEKDYKLLGCYESFEKNDIHRKMVEAQCDKVYCGTFHNGRKVSWSKGDAAKMNKKILDKKGFRETKGYEFLIITLLEVYKNSYGRRGFRVKDLQVLLYSSIQKKSCIGERHLKEILENMKSKKLIEITTDKKRPKDFKEQHLRLARRLQEFQKGYIEFYFSIANALIDGKISQLDYVVYLALVNNLQDGKKVTYEELAETIGLDGLTPNEIGKHIRKLNRERCLIVEKVYTDRGYECNKYTLIDPNGMHEQDATGSMDAERDADYEINIKLLA